MADAKTTSASTTGKRPRNILGTIVGYLLVIFLLFFLMLVFGRVSGTEVSADSLARRNYTFFQIPLVRIQCTPVWRSSGNDRVANTILQEGYLLPNVSTDRWDVIEVHVGGRMMRGKAEILDRYLSLSEESGQAEDWESWTLANPQHAKVLWPAVHRAVVLEAYEVLPELFQAAESTADPDELKEQIEALASRQLADVAADYAEVGETVRAAKLYEAALEYRENEAHRRAYQSLKSQL